MDFMVSDFRAPDIADVQSQEAASATTSLQKLTPATGAPLSKRQKRKRQGQLPKVVAIACLGPLFRNSPARSWLSTGGTLPLSVPQSLQPAATARASPLQLRSRVARPAAGEASAPDDAMPALLRWPATRRALAAALFGVGGALAVGRSGPKGGAAEAADDRDIEVEKSPIDLRQYRALTLPNGVRVLLVSDENADRSGAALDVHVGFLSDPEDLPGLAHFCEHMLFLGTSKYPDESSFDNFLTANGGSSNAYTDDDDTCFYFNIGNDAFAEALDRFGSFFEGPLFTPSATDRELNAINSEHEKNLQSDGFRMSQLTRSRANPKHPFSHFGTGTAATLTARKDLRAALIAHYEKYYRGPLMTLCVVGREDLKTLEKYALQSFKDIRGAAEGGTTQPYTSWAGTTPFLANAFETVQEVVPAADERTIEVSFPLLFKGPSEKDITSGGSGLTLDTWRKYAPATHINGALGHEGPKSLCALLRRKGWATGVTAGLGESREDFASLSVEVELTEDGLKHREDVLDLLFGNIKRLRDRSQWPQELLDENLLLSEANWRSLESHPTRSAAVAYASIMQKYKAREYNSGPSRLNGGPELPAVVAATLEVLTPSNAIVTVTSKAFEGVAKKAERWYGTKFNEAPTAPLRKRWEAAQPAATIDFPAPNQFVPRKLDLKAPRSKALPKGVPIPAPSVLQRDDRWRLWFRQDTEFGAPRAYAVFELLTPFVHSTARTRILASLYQMIFEDIMAETLLYDARAAGLTFEFSTSVRGVQILLGGYDDRIADFTRVLFQSLIKFKPGANKDRFEAQRDTLRREIDSLSVQQPYQQAGYWQRQSTQPQEASIDDLKAATLAVTPQDVDDFVDQLWRREKLYGQVLCQGNFNEADAKELVKIANESITFAPLPQAQWPKAEVSKVPIRSDGIGHVLLHNTMEEKEENSVACVYFQTGSCRAANGEEGRSRWAVTSVLGALLRPRFYTELRTQQQLGYVVSSSADRKDAVCRLQLVVQGTTLEPLAVLGRIDEFLVAFRKELAESTTDAKVQEVSASLAEARLERAGSLGEAINKVWTEIATREFLWDRVVSESKALRRVTRADVLKLFDSCVAGGGAERRRLVNLVYGAAHKGQRPGAEAKVEALGGVVVADAASFADAQPRWEPLGME
eukprot:TRINITY_DN32951_c0_g1_i1.p1 TRINITY_DN32951_c0_g1~~TRINITY_DN32951_c0_g1_i1.p1  ORF type:complete len:1153 (-),score=229.08 TRINITY_DN32951_c0_g1_i1:37-3495(-)